ncbi:MAG: iron-containing alcohol dehydrogenase [Clostridia bacterium]
MGIYRHGRGTEKLRHIPGLVELEAGTGTVHLNRTALPRAADRIVFGRGLAANVVPEAVAGLVEPARPGILVVVGESSSKAPGIAALVDSIKSLGEGAGGGAGSADRWEGRTPRAWQATPSVRIFVVRGHADHATIRAGIEAVRRDHAGLVVAVGGGTIIDVGKSIAALAHQDGEGNTSWRPGRAAQEDAGAQVGPTVCMGDESGVEPEVAVDITAYQVGRRRPAPERALPWVAVPTTSGTGSESTDNAVIELGDEKKSLRGIPASRFIAADPALTDPLPLAPTIVAAVDALAQSLEVFTSSAASAEVQEVALAAFAALARGIEDLSVVAARVIGETEPGGTPPATPERQQMSAVRAASPDSAGKVAPATRDTLSWGSLLMGIAFANGRLGLPHALVHFCNRFGLSHGNMVGILLAPGLAVQARDPETARRLARAAHTLDEALRCDDVPSTDGRTPAPPVSQTCVRCGPELLFHWLGARIPTLFEAAGLPRSLRAAGFTRADLDWIVARELESRPSFGTPARPATPGELREVFERADGVVSV